MSENSYRKLKTGKRAGTTKVRDQGQLKKAGKLESQQTLVPISEFTPQDNFVQHMNIISNN